MIATKRDYVLMAIALILMLGMYCMVGCAAVKGYVDPYARQPMDAWEILCGEEGQVTRMCRDEGQGCEEAELTCDLLAIALDVMEVVK